MLETLSIALAHVKASSTTNNLLNEIRQIVYFKYIIIQLNQCKYKLDTKPFHSQQLLINLTKKIDLQRSVKTA